MTTEPRSEADAVAELTAGPVEIVSFSDLESVTALPPQWTTHRSDLERLQEQPSRSRGTIRVHGAEAFMLTLRARRVQEYVVGLYADSEHNALVAVLNDDGGPATGWRDYRVSLDLRRTPEWEHWRKHDHALLSQEAFAEHIEAGLKELVDPDHATVLELAQTFHATNSARFKSGRRLQSGETQFVYEEDVEAKAGKDGTIAVPTHLTLSVAPFLGSEPVEVSALFRFRLTRENLTLGYRLERPHEVERKVFEQVRIQVEETTGIEAVAGPAPEPTPRLPSV